MREDDNNIILRKHREVQRYSFQNISTQVNKFQVSTQTIYSNACARAFPQCDQTFSGVITKCCAEILPNWIFFYQTRANSAF